jgi:hypothetical protein
MEDLYFICGLYLTLTIRVPKFINYVYATVTEMMTNKKTFCILLCRKSLECRAVAVMRTRIEPRYYTFK